jgi:VanZ family protein
VSRRALANWGPLLLALAAVFWLSSLPQVPGAGLAWDKLLHVVGYAGLGVIALRAFHGGVVRPRPGPTLAAGLFLLLWGISDEYHQSFVPGRDASGADVVADLIGFMIACALLYAWAARQKRAASAGA